MSVFTQTKTVFTLVNKNYNVQFNHCKRAFMRLCTMWLFCFGTMLNQAKAQNIGINVLVPDASAVLDVTANTRGMLVPRVQLVASNNPAPVVAPALSLLVFNLLPAGVFPNNVKTGYYYWDGTKWVAIGTGNAWELTGNAGTTAGTNFIGTTDAQDLVFKTNGVENMRIQNGSGSVGIGTNAPTNKLHIVGGVNPLKIERSGVDNWEFAIDLDRLYTYNGSTGNYVLTMNKNGNVGIGTNAPNEKLEVQGSVKIVDGTQGVGKVLTSDATGKGSWVANIPQNYIGTISAAATYGVSYPTPTDLGDQVVISTPGTYMIVYQRYFYKLSGGGNDFHLVLSDNNFSSYLSDVTLSATPQNYWFQGSVIQIQTYTAPTVLKGGYLLFNGNYTSISNGSCMFAIRLQ